MNTAGESGQNRVRLFLAGVAGVLAGGVFTFILPAYELPIAFPRPVAFDPAAWRPPGDPRELPTGRLAMAGDLIERVLPSGMPRERVHELLGAPSRWPIFLGSSWFREDDEAWWLGKSPSRLRPGDDWLVLDFDSSGRLLHAGVVNEQAAGREHP
jgi:hypothetical protein